MDEMALEGLTVVDIGGTVATGYCAKLAADYGATVVNLEPRDGFATRRLRPFRVGFEPPDPDASAMHAFLSTNKQSVIADAVDAEALVASADLVLLGDEPQALAAAATSVVTTIDWYGRGGPYEDFVGTDGAMFALNGMLRGIGPVEGPPIVPTGYQAQIVAGSTALIASLSHVLAGELGNRQTVVELEVSIFESVLCFTDVGAIGFHNTGLEAPRMGVNRFPPTYPLGIYPCRDGWLGVTVLTPSQWHSFCDLLGMEDLAGIDLFQSSIGRLQGIDVIEPMMTEKLLAHSAEDLFYRGQRARVPLARVPTMEELFEVDQYRERQAFSTAALADGSTLTVPSVSFRLFDTPPNFGGPVASLGEQTAAWA